ncbi:MAG: nucleotidyltransferase domain-containing protein [Nanoarchaeota archaeon]
MKLLITQLTKISKFFFKKYKKELKDIILFGSVIRGKSDPKDIDIVMLFKDNINKNIEYKFKKLILNYIQNVSIISKTEKTYINPYFDAREGILFEGYSLIKSRFIAEEFGFISFGLFFYNTKKITNVKRTRLYYALNGRLSNKGVIDKWGAIRLSDNIIAIPINNIESAKEFFEYWNLDYRYIPSLIPQRLGKKNLLGKIK